MTTTSNLNPKAKLFITSLPCDFDYPTFYKKNHFLENLTKFWKQNSKILYITASPDEPNDDSIDFFKKCITNSNLTFSKIDLCDSKNYDQKLESYDVIFLGGGHVPTQKKFFDKINLQKKIYNFEGIIIGISAGSMNSAKIVYAQPELKGEAIDPNYVRFFEGLNLTEFMILPHYYSLKDETLDGFKIIDEITFNDSVGKKFYILPDGSYILQTCEECYLYGEAFIVENKKMEKICNNDEKIKLY